MLSVFICEDNPAHLKKIEEAVETIIMIDDYDMKLELATTNPDELIRYMAHTSHIRGVYFLDIDLNHSLNGLELAALIRKKDIDAKIIFITTHSELLSLTFTYKLEVLDYIIKDEPQLIKKRIRECLETTHNYYISPKRVEENRLKFNLNNQTRYFSLDDIMFFETTDTPHKIRLHLTNSTVELYDSLGAIEKMSDDLVRIHKSYLVNQRNVSVLDTKERIVTMTNGERCLISIRKINLLK